MKATDLMVGDLVYIHEPECKWHRIDYISEIDEEVGADGELYSVNDIRPIPLTEEILDDINFFQDHKYFTLGITKETRIVLKRIDEEDNKWYASVITVFDEIGHTYVHHVHQLQHLMQLCGIEKEITI